MTELVQSVRLKYEGKEIVGEIASTKAALADLAAEARKAGTSSAGIAEIADKAAASTAALGTAAVAAGDLAQAAGNVAPAAAAIGAVAGEAATAGNAMAAAASEAGGLSTAVSAVAGGDALRDLGTQAAAAGGDVAGLAAMVDQLDAALAAGGASGAAAAARGLTDALGSQISATRGAVTAQGDLEKRVTALAAAMAPASRGQVDLNGAITLARGLFADGAISATTLAEAESALASVHGEAGASAGTLGGKLREAGASAGGLATAVIATILPTTELGAAAGATTVAVTGLGAAGGVTEAILTGGLSLAITAVGTLLGALVAELFATDEAAGKADEGLAALQRRQADLGNFIDATTGRLREQNRTLLANAQLQRRNSIDQSNTSVVGLRDRAFAAAREQLGERGFTRAGPNDVELAKAIRDAGASVVVLDRNLQALAQRRGDLAGLRQTVSDFAGQAVVGAQRSAALRGELVELGVAIRGGTVLSTGLIERQVALGRATDGVSRAEANLSAVRDRAAAIDQMPAGEAKGEALRKYRSDLEAATAGVEAARASEERAVPAHRARAAASGEAARASREEAAAARELDQSLAALVKRYDPARAAAAGYAAELQRIEALRGSGRIGDGDALKFSIGAQRDYQGSLADLSAKAAQPFLDVTKPFEDAMEAAIAPASVALADGAEEAGAAFERRGVRAASVIGDMLGGKAGRAVEGLLALVAPETAGGRGSGGVGGLAALIRGTGSADPYGGRSAAAVREAGGLAPGSTAAAVLGTTAGVRGGTRSGVEQFSDSIAKLAKGVGISDEAASTIGRKAGIGIEGAAKGALVASVFNPIAKGLGLETSKLGAQAGGALGALSGIPGGDIIGSVAGSLLGGLLKTQKKGSATIGNVAGEAAITGTSGNSAAYIKEATGAAGGVVDAIDSIVQQLGGTLGDFSVSIGKSKKKYRVDTSGQGRTTAGKSNDGVTGYDTIEEAQAAALADAIADGAIAGVSAAVQRALQSSDDANKAIREALKVQSIEDIMTGLGADLVSSFRSFEQQAKQRVETARKYGFDVAKIEAYNAEQRAALVDSTTRASVGSLQNLLESLATGDLSEGDAAAKRDALLGKITTARADVAAGKSGAGDTLAGYLQTLVESDRESFGTAGPEYAASRELAKTAAEEAVRSETDRIAAAQKATDATNAALATANTLADENNDQNAQMIALLKQIAASRGGSGGSAAVTLDLNLVRRLV